MTYEVQPAVKIFGLDYSTAPSTARPTFLAEAELVGNDLRLATLVPSTKPILPELLSVEGPWILGLDVPFSVPREFCTAVGWPEDWDGMCEAAAALAWSELTALAASFRAERPEGSKEAYRPCDRAARALPPTRTANPPLLRMFQVAGPILAAATVDVAPFRMAGRDRTVVEVYPKLVAQRLARESYRHSEQVRREMLRAVGAGALRAEFGYDVRIAPAVLEIAAANDGADALDSIFCAIEAAWVSRRGVGACVRVDGTASQGWIVDPALVPLEPQPRPSVRLRHYGRKCDQHLCRVRMSLDLATAGLGAGSHSEAGRDGRWREAFADSEPAEIVLKLERGLSEIHLIALKAEFELFLNRVLTVLWTSHFEALTPDAAKGSVPLKDVARVAASSTSVRALVVDYAVPRHGLRDLTRGLEKATGVKFVSSFDPADWAQVRVAFAVRHLIEHTDARIDSAFCEDVKSHWAQTSWVEHVKTPAIGERIPVSDGDVERTFAAMRRVAAKATDLLVDWSDEQRTGA